MGCVEMEIFTVKFNESLVGKFYANLTADVDNDNSPAFEQVYVRGIGVAFSPTNIATYMSCLYYLKIECTGLKEELDLDAMIGLLQVMMMFSG